MTPEESLTSNAVNAAPHTAVDKHDCGCGCGGSGDCEDAKKPESRARRSFLLGGGTVVFVSTLANHRAFAGGSTACGPISAAMSPTSAGRTNIPQCGGLTPGYWAQHQDVAGKYLGAGTNPCASLSGAALTSCQNSTAYKSYVTTLKNILSTKTLGSYLPHLSLIDPASAGMTFCKSFDKPHSDYGFHWMCAILCALSPDINTAYGYTISSLDQALQTAANNHVPLLSIIGAIEKLENDYPNLNSLESTPAFTVC